MFSVSLNMMCVFILPSKANGIISVFLVMFIIYVLIVCIRCWEFLVTNLRAAVLIYLTLIYNRLFNETIQAGCIFTGHLGHLRSLSIH